MKLATCIYQGRQWVGLLSDDGMHLHPLNLSDAEAERGVLALVDRNAAGQPFPTISSETIALTDVRL